MIRFYADDLGCQYGYRDIDIFLESHEASQEANRYLHLRLTKDAEANIAYMVVLAKAGPDGEELCQPSEVAIPVEVFDAFKTAMRKEAQV